MAAAPAPPAIVIVGASLAGLRAAQACRAAGHTGPLTIVGAEPHLPYNRPPLSKQLLRGTVTTDELTFERGDVEAEWLLGNAAVALDPRAHRLTLADGELSYDRLIIATGTRARGWPGEGGELSGLMTLRTVDDGRALAARLRGARRLLIAGAGFIGCEVAAAARSLGIDVTLVDPAPTPMAPLGPLVGAWCAELHRSRGVDLRLGTGIERWRGDGRLEGAVLSSGETVTCDVAVLALGAVPCGEWLDGSGLALERGSLVCDSTLTSVSDPDILGAGDIVSCAHPLADGDLVRVEHWSNAVEQGMLAGANALLEVSERVAFTGIPAFWSDLYEHRLQSVGLPARAEHVEIVDGSVDADSFVAVGHRDGEMVAALGLNAAPALRRYRRELAELAQTQATALAGRA